MRGNERHGQGVFIYEDGDGIYEGQWKFGLMEGKGKLYYKDGVVAYEGDWKNNSFHGIGKLYNKLPVDLDGSFGYENFDELEDHWMHYKGDFVDDLKEGFGTILLTNGDKYVGNLK